MEKELKDQINETLNELKEKLINNKVTSEKFTDEQIGMIKCWMEEAYNLGKENALTEYVMGKIKDEDIAEIKNCVNRMFGKFDNDDVNVWKSMYQTQRNIVTLLMSEIYQLLCVVDKDRYDYSAMGLCSLK